VRKITVQGSTFRNNSCNDGGGGALEVRGQLSDDSKAVIEDSTFEGNEAKGSGGALKIGPNTILRKLTLKNNRAVVGGGLFIAANDASIKNPVMLDNLTVTGNSASQFGGGIDNGGSMVLQNSLIENNSAGTDGGGVASYENQRTEIINSRIIGNSAKNNGGGIFDRHFSFGSNNINPVTSLYNKVTVDKNTAGNDGGGVYSIVSVKFVDSVISNNKAGVSGGGVLTFAGFTYGSQRQLYPVQFEAVGSKITGNSAQEGGGIYHNAGVTVLSNTDITGNKATGSKGGGGIYLDKDEFPATSLNPSEIKLSGGNVSGNEASNGDCVNLTCK
jgi:hypothetical protein